MIKTKIPTFKDKNLLVTALSHRSSLNEKKTKKTLGESNERLEFLGDAVLELATTIFLFDRFPKEPEGTLTLYRSSLVKTSTLAEAALGLGLDKQMYLSKGEENGGGRKNESLLADTMEAVVGAIYLDQGFDNAYSFLKQSLFAKFDDILKNKSYRDSKSMLQEFVQAKGLPTPTYRLINSVGPDHDKTFFINVLVGSKVIGQGKGNSKQEAQQEAARVALEKIS